VTSTITNGYSPVFYNQTDFSPSYANALNGRGMSGDSGGGWYNSQGHLIGMNVAGTLGTGTIGQTTYLRFDNPDIQNWISTTVPAPGTAVLGLAAMVFAARRRR
jgi:uncharacterized protein (TIGR03382 family)